MAPHAELPFRLSALAKRRLKYIARTLGKSEAQAAEIAITHLLATLEHNQGVWITTKPLRNTSHKTRLNAA
jgi:predicted DNA-binding protein